jgi:hypothetical protein
VRSRCQRGPQFCRFSPCSPSNGAWPFWTRSGAVFWPRFTLDARSFQFCSLDGPAALACSPWLRPDLVKPLLPLWCRVLANTCFAVVMHWLLSRLSRAESMALRMRSRSHRFHGEWTWEVSEGSLIFPRLREHWAAFCAVAAGSSPPSILPRWQETETKTHQQSATETPADSDLEDIDDELPF